VVVALLDLGVLYVNQVLAPPYVHMNLYPVGFMGGDLSGVTDTVIDQGTSIDRNFCVEGPGSCTWCG